MKGLGGARKGFHQCTLRLNDSRYLNQPALTRWTLTFRGQWKQTATTALVGLFEVGGDVWTAGVAILINLLGVGG